MDAVADEQPTQNESTEDWKRDKRTEGGGGWVQQEEGGGVQKGNGAAAGLVAMITR